MKKLINNLTSHTKGEAMNLKCLFSKDFSSKRALYGALRDEGDFSLNMYSGKPSSRKAPYRA
ncbi:hypothetical protein [Marinobacter adhaerens]|uniref:hypothetical protein n=1 Tax=Marinobacter adhaerens TaxID=1033846 RepID=UPI003BAB7D7B